MEGPTILIARLGGPFFDKKSEETKGKLEKCEAQKLKEAQKIVWEGLLKK